MRRGIWTLLIFGGLAAAYYGVLALNWLGTPPDAGTIQGAALPPENMADKDRRLAEAAADGQILFGDLHVHTTYSSDAFLWSLPMNGGSSAHPIANACDYARYCSNLDFWAITDHASALSKRKWLETKEAMRACAAVSGEGTPDVIPLTGFEWTQVGDSPANHYGHKNVIFRGMAESDLPERPIAAGGLSAIAMRTLIPEMPPALSLVDFMHQKRYQDFNAFLREVRAMEECDATKPRAEWQDGCYEEVNDPGLLVARLEEQGFDPLLIPHGGAWGLYTPAGTTLDKQLKPDMRPEAFQMIEVMSGHGNAEEYRPWRAAIRDEEGKATCPKPSEGFLPQCWRAGEIIEERCLTEGESADECTSRASSARDAFLRMGAAGLASVPGTYVDEWLDSDQCQDCFLPAFSYRPGGSVQYGLAISNFDQGAPLRNRWAFIAASDNHRARPGTGYKPVDRMNTTEANGPRSEMWATLMGDRGEKKSSALYATQQELIDSGAGMALADFERQSSFFVTGGLAAVHSQGRDRSALWDGLDNRQVYGTSGPRILLWFDLVEGAKRLPMGSEVVRSTPPSFEVRAVGSFRQKPGCPDTAVQGLSAERLESLCANECYNPSDERRLITRIEVVRIRPQAFEGEAVENLIDDPWQVLPCPQDAAGCAVTFTDPEFTRDSVYYVRAIEEPSAAINGANLRCERDGEGNCLNPKPCFGDYRTDAQDNCAAPTEQRAWSSPIYVDFRD